MSSSTIERILGRRGPDNCSTLCIDRELNATGCVLHIQGGYVCSQPLSDDHGNVLLWNGEVFGGLQYNSKTQSDTEIIFNGLNGLFSPPNNAFERSASALVSEYLSHICGPYAFIYYNRKLNMLFYGRDPFGRRSLLLIKSASTAVTSNSTVGFPHGVVGIISVAPTEAQNDQNDSSLKSDFTYEEVDILGIYTIRLLANSLSAESVTMCSSPPPPLTEVGDVILQPWPSHRIKLQRWNVDIPFQTLGTGPNPFETVPLSLDTDGLVDTPVCEASKMPSWVSNDFLEVLMKSVRCRLSALGGDPTSVSCQSLATHTDSGAVSNSAPYEERIKPYAVGVLFSGGIDSVLLAVLLHKCLLEIEESEGGNCENGVKLSYSIDLINVSFYTDSDAGCDSYYDDKMGTHGEARTETQDKHRKLPSPDRIAAIVAYGELKVK